MKVIIHDQAEDDLVRNAEWWAKHYSAEEAIEWYHHAVEALKNLESFSHSHPLSFENDLFPYEIRDCLFGFGSRPSYRGIFTVHNGSVHVLTVQRSAQRPVRPADVSFEVN